MYLFALAFVGLTIGMSASGPIALDPNSRISGSLSGQSMRLADGASYDCYSIETKAEEPVLVTLSASSFEGRLWISRGGQCQSARLHHDSAAQPQTAETEPHVTVLRFVPSGGRYLVIVRPRHGEGRGPYSLSLTGGMAQPTADENPALGEDRRQALMTAQLRRREAQLAAEAVRRAEQAERERQAAYERQQAEAYARAEAEEAAANRWNLFNAALGGFVSGYTSETQTNQQIRNNQQVFLNDLQRQTDAISRQRQAAEQAQARALAAEREARQVGSRPAASNSRHDDRADQAEVSEAEQKAREEAQAKEEASRQRDEARRAAEQRQIQQAEQQRLAENARRQDEQRRAAADRERMRNTRPNLSTPPPLGTLGQDWSPWHNYASHNGVIISWRARRYDRQSLSLQWQCDNRSSETRYCSINDKAYDCYSGQTVVGSGGGISEAADVSANRQYSFVSEIACRGSNLSFVLPRARVLATPTP